MVVIISNFIVLMNNSSSVSSWCKLGCFLWNVVYVSIGRVMVGISSVIVVDNGVSVICRMSIGFYNSLLC